MLTVGQSEPGSNENEGMTQHSLSTPDERMTLTFI